MKMIPYFVLTPDERFLVRRVEHLVGYELTGEMRENEIKAAGCLFRRNDPFRVDHYEAAHAALTALHARLVASSNPERWGKQEAFMAEERAVQAAEVANALEELPNPNSLPSMPVIDEKYTQI